MAKGKTVSVFPLRHSNYLENVIYLVSVKRQFFVKKFVKNAEYRVNLFTQRLHARDNSIADEYQNVITG